MSEELMAAAREAKQSENAGVQIPGEEAPNEETLQDMGEAPSDIEVRASEAGWHKGGKDKDGNELSADEFLARKPLFNKIHGLQDKYDRDITELKEMVRSLQDDNKKITVSAMQKQQELMSELKVAKEQALNDLDVDKVKQIDSQIDQVRDNISQGQATHKVASKDEWNKSYFNFLKDNAWYDTNPGLAKAGDIIAREIMQKNPETAPDKLYSSVAEEIRKQFPDRFVEKQTEKVNKVSSSNSRGTQKAANKQVRLADLPEEERRIVKNMMEMTGKTEEEYLKNYEL